MNIKLTDVLTDFLDNTLRERIDELENHNACTRKIIELSKKSLNLTRERKKERVVKLSGIIKNRSESIANLHKIRAELIDAKESE